MPTRRHNTFNYVADVPNLTWPSLTKPAVIGTFCVYTGVRIKPAVVGRKAPPSTVSRDHLLQNLLSFALPPGTVVFPGTDQRRRTENRWSNQVASPRCFAINEQTRRFSALPYFLKICDWFRILPSAGNSSCLATTGHVSGNVIGKSETICLANPLTNAVRSIINCRSYSAYDLSINITFFCYDVPLRNLVESSVER